MLTYRANFACLPTGKVVQSNFKIILPSNRRKGHKITTKLTAHEFFFLTSNLKGIFYPVKEFQAQKFHCFLFMLEWRMFYLCSTRQGGIKLNILQVSDWITPVIHPWIQVK